MKEIAFGIDFGTTNSIAASWGESVRLARQATAPVALWHQSNLGNKPHPSVVWYGPRPEPVVGVEARQNMQTYEGMGHAFIRSIKRKLGRDEAVEIIGGQRKPAWEIAAEIFKHLKRHAETHPLLAGINAQLTQAVVTVPVTFGGQQRRDIRRAMERAGLRLQCFLHEPFAALVGHFYDPVTKLNKLRGQRVLVFDWGGGTLDVCLAEVSEDGSRIFELSHDGIEDRAGDDFDRKLMTDLKRRLLSRSGTKLDDVELKGSAKDRFWLRSEAGKIELSSQNSTRVEVPNIFEIFGKPIDLSEELARSEFEALIVPEVKAAEACVLRCVERARLTPDLVDHVLMVGGTSSIPAVRQMLEHTFGARVLVANEPDAAIARGAAIVAAEDWKPYVVKPLCVKLADDTFLTFIPAGTPLQPDESRHFTFYCTDPRPANAHFFFYESSALGDHSYRSLDVHLSVPTAPEIHGIGNMDRIVARFVVTEDATIQCHAQSGSVEKVVECEIHDICFGLQL